MSETDLDNKEQGEVDSDAQVDYASQVAAVPANKPPLWIWVGLSALLLVALLVIFVLPNIVSEYELPLERRVDLAELQRSATTEADSATTISPFEEAQRALQRKEAQDVLAELLELQSDLDALEVLEWGQVDYEAALEQASIGDEYYRNQDFVLSAESYTRGRDALADLQETVPDVLARIYIDADNALTEGDSAVAQDKYSLALLFDPDNEAAQIGLERARALDEVNDLFATADELFEEGELEAARETYRQIIALDSYNDPARDRIDAVSAQIVENEFGRIMSRGYSLLEASDPDQAIAAFEQAAALGVNQEQALAAIEQTENQVANAQINRLRELIATAEAAEQWQSAVGEYDRVLEIDPNLLFAIEGRDYADKRAHLNQLLVNAIANPERFAEDAVFQETLDVYYTGRAINPIGPVLGAQLDELEVLLENSQVPVEVQLISDSLTDVTLMRIENLGLFEQTSVSLKPGRYVAVGRRAGYREVREEFVVGFGQTPDAVVVRCEERVVATNR